MRLVLRDSLEIDPDSVLYRHIVRNYRLLPPFLNKFYSDLDKVEMIVPDPKMFVTGPVSAPASLEVLTTSRQFQGLKVSLPEPNKLELEWDGRKMGMFDYTLGPDFLTFKTTEGDGDEVEVKFKWTGSLPANPDEAAAFLLENRLELAVRDPSRGRTSDIGLTWRMNRLRFPGLGSWSSVLRD